MNEGKVKKIKEKFMNFEKNHKWAFMGIGWTIAVGTHIAIGEVVARHFCTDPDDKYAARCAEVLCVAFDLGGIVMQFSYERDISKMDEAYEIMKTAYVETRDICYDLLGDNPFASYNVEVNEVPAN